VLASTRFAGNLASPDGSLCQPSFMLRFEAAESGRAGHTVPIHQPSDEQIGGPSATRFRLIQSETKSREISAGGLGLRRRHSSLAFRANHIGITKMLLPTASSP
jgi:hypothetical protein